MRKYFFAIIFAASITGLILLNGCGENKSAIQEPVIGKNTENESQSREQPESMKSDGQILQLMLQLQTALRSGGISPKAYEEIDGKIKYFESNGYEKNLTQELRIMLSQLSIGGQKSESIKNETVLVQDKSVEKANSANSDIVIWQYMDGAWKPNGKPPACPETPVFQAPVDLDLPTSVLYPGQKRNGDFKPHGGFRIDGNNIPVEVKAPLEGYVWRVAKFYDEFGVHYMVEIQNPCGIMYRLGHLGAVPAKLEAVFDTVPIGENGDSRTHEVKSVFVELGETIATDTQHGSGFDWGVYDLRKENDASQDPSFREAHKDEPSQAYHALCWLDYLSADEQKIVKLLPAADGNSGKISSYC